MVGDLIQSSSGSKLMIKLRVIRYFWRAIETICMHSEPQWPGSTPQIYGLNLKHNHCTVWCWYLLWKITFVIYSTSNCWEIFNLKHWPPFKSLLNR